MRMGIKTAGSEETNAKKFTLHPKEYVFLLLSFIAALILREAVHVRLFPDSINYLTFARNIIDGIHHTGDISFLVRYRRPPLYPHLVALLSFGRSDPLFLVEIARQVSIFAGCLTILPLYTLSKKMLGRVPAVISTLLLVFNPESVFYSGCVLTESLSGLFVLVGLSLLWTFSTEPPRRTIAFLLGIVLGLGFLSKHLVIGFLPIFFVWILVHSNTHIFGREVFVSIRRKTEILCLLCAGFLLIISPQVAYLHSQTGKWTLAVDPFSIMDESIKKGGKDVRYSTQYEARASLTEDLKNYRWESRDTTSAFGIIKKHPVQYLKAYIKTVTGGYLSDLYPIPYPKILLVLVVIGIGGLIYEKKIKELLFLLIVFTLYYLFVSIFLNLRDRYMFLAYPVLIIIAGYGGRFLIDILTKITGKTQKKNIVLSVIIILLILISAINVIKFISKINKYDNLMIFAELGEDLSRRIQPRSYIFDRTPHLAYFAGGTKATPPFAKIEDVVDFGKRRGVRYWIVSNSYVNSMRPQYKELLDPKIKYEGLRKVVTYQMPGERIIVYEIEMPIK